MPVKPPNQSSKVKEAPNTFTQKRLRDSRGADRRIEQNPRSPKTDREDIKGDRQNIYDTQGFKKALEDVQKNFGSRINPGVNSKVKRP